MMLTFCTDVICGVRSEVLSMIITRLSRDVATRKRTGFKPACAGFTAFGAASPGTATLCDAAILGGLTIHVDGRYISAFISSINESVVGVASGVFPKIKKVETLPHHPQCSLVPKYAGLSTKIHDDLPSIVAKHIKPAHIAYMEGQRNKTGIELSGAGQKQTQARRYW